MRKFSRLVRKAVSGVTLWSGNPQSLAFPQSEVGGGLHLS